jgi:hypothetical protein
MWLIRKIVVRRNIAGCPIRIQKMSDPSVPIVKLSETRRFCIFHHNDNTTQVSLVFFRIHRVLVCCHHDRQKAGIYLGGVPEPAEGRRRLSSAIGRIFPMKRTAITLFVAVTALAAAACGQTIEQRAATGAVAGAVVAGPIGAAVGGAAGAAVGQAQKPN